MGCNETTNFYSTEVIRQIPLPVNIKFKGQHPKASLLGNSKEYSFAKINLPVFRL